MKVRLSEFRVSSFEFRTSSVVAVVVMLAMGVSSAGAQTPEERAARYLDSVRGQPPLLLDFLERLPKGADLHHHLSGAVYAETYIGLAAHDGLCVDTNTLALLDPPCDAAKNQPAASQGLTNQTLRDQMIDAWSMRNFYPSPEDRSGHDHFFATFGKFGPASDAHTGELLAEAVSRAASQHELYVETMFTPDHGGAAALGKKLGWDDDFGRMREKLLASGLAPVVASGSQALDAAEKQMRLDLHCEGQSGVSAPDPGCGVVVRYLYQVLRGIPKEEVFAQILTGMEMAKADPRVVGLNLVMPEDGITSMRDFDLQMHMLDFLHGLYPDVAISLHAGELTAGLVPPDGLRFHIRESVELGHASRIGHGVDVMYENEPLRLLRAMAARHVLVEVCLTSNDVILGVSGNQHPFPIYLRYNVPVALATDDEGVSRSELTWEFKRAVETYHLSYVELKKMVRDSLDHGFLAGASLWRAPEEFRPVAACAGVTEAQSPSPACQRVLAGSEKAKLEWKEEGEFRKFESEF
ncbi:MAG: adenosine deaminase family protein [Terriglobia bacterium]